MQDFNISLWKAMKFFLTILIVVGLIGYMMDRPKETSNTTDKPFYDDDKIKKSETPAIPSEPKLTSAQLLNKAKKLRYNNNFSEAIDTLNKIELESKEYPEAQELLTKITKQLEVYDKINKRDERKSYAQFLENYFLNNAKMDTTITTSGKDHTILKIKYILMSRVLVNELTKDGKLPSRWEQMGFKTIIFTDGHYRSWTMNLKEKS